MRNKRLVKTAVCGAILSASLMVSQQNINAAQEGSALSSEAKKNEASQNISESDTEQNAAANENQPQDSNSDPSSPGAGNTDEKADDTEDNSAEDPNAPSDGTVSDQPADESNQSIPIKTGWVEEEDGTHYYKEDGTPSTHPVFIGMD